MLSSRLENLHPYVPGEQPTDRVYIKLNANENPYPPSPAATEAVKKAIDENPRKLSLYPDPDSNELRDSIAELLNSTGGVLCTASIQENENGKSVVPSEKDKIPFKITRDMIFCGNGSDEVLSFVFYTFFDSNKPLVLPEHTYSFYPVYCGFYNIPMRRIPLNADWTLDTQAITKASNENESCTIFANPNAPTGLSLSREQIRQMLKDSKNTIFVVDEAYCDFGGESCIPLLAEFENLVIVRTFSKSLSFAGMRLGYTIASPALTKALFTVKNSFNHLPVDFITQTAAKASCKDAAYYVENAKKVVEEREDFIQFLRERGWFVIDSHTNFIFTKKDGISGQKVYEKVKAGGILIRHFNTPGIEDFVRISIGTKEQMASLKQAMQNL